MKITNFTQDGGTDRAVVEVTLPGDTENGGTTNVLTATRIDFSTGSNAHELSRNWEPSDNCRPR